MALVGFSSFPPTTRLLENLDRLKTVQDDGRSLIQEIQNLPISAWKGFELNLLYQDEKPTLESMNRQYRGVTPILNKYKVLDGFEYAVYGLDEHGLPVLSDIETTYEWFYSQCKDVEFTQTLTPLKDEIEATRVAKFNNIMKGIVQMYHLHEIEPEIAKKLYLDLETSEKLAKYLVLNSASLKDSVNHHWYDLYTTLDREQNSFPYLTLYFYFNQKTLESALRIREYLESDWSKICLPQNYSCFISFLFDASVDHKLKAEFLLKLDDATLREMLKLTSAEYSENTHPLLEFVSLIISKNQDCLTNSSFIHEISITRSDLSFEKIACEISEQFTRKFMNGEYSIGEFDKIYYSQTGLFRRLTDSDILYQVCLKLVNFLNESEIELKLKEKIIYLILERTSLILNSDGEKSTRNYGAIQSKCLLYLINHWKKHQLWLKENQSSLKKSSAFTLQGEFVEKMNLLDFYHEGTSEIFGNKFADILSSLILDSHANIPSELWPYFLPKLYQSGLDAFPKMIFEKESTAEDSAIHDEQLVGEIQTIHNNSGYLNEKNPSGKPLYLDKEKSIPIGYNIHLPPVEIQIKDVIVMVYGGSIKNERETKAYKPNNLKLYAKYLLNRGTIVITLNLPDLLELDTSQDKMPESLFLKIQASIDKFYHTLKASPESFHEDLKKIKFESLNTFLCGASFGGMMVIRHAELYPGTFTGYISHAGVLSKEIVHKSDLVGRSAMSAWLDPSPTSEINKLRDRILLVQDENDYNVNVKGVLHFYQLLEASGKAHLARIYIYKAGGKEKSGEISYIGHGMPQTKAKFLEYMSMWQDFRQNHQTISALNSWIVYRKDKRMNNHYKSATVQERFLSDELNRHTPKKELWDEKNKLRYSQMVFVESLVNNSEKCDKELERLKNHNLLTDSAMEKVVQSHEKRFIWFVKAKYNISLPDGYLKNHINKEIISSCRNHIFNLQFDRLFSPEQWPLKARFIFTSLYDSNPDLLQPLSSQLAVEFELSKQYAECEKEWENILLKEKKMITLVWQQTIKQVIKKGNKHHLEEPAGRLQLK